MTIFIYPYKSICSSGNSGNCGNHILLFIGNIGFISLFRRIPNRVGYHFGGNGIPGSGNRSNPETTVSEDVNFFGYI